MFGFRFTLHLSRDSWSRAGQGREEREREGRQLGSCGLCDMRANAMRAALRCQATRCRRAVAGEWQWQWLRRSRGARHRSHRKPQGEEEEAAVTTTCHTMRGEGGSRGATINGIHFWHYKTQAEARKRLGSVCVAACVCVPVCVCVPALVCVRVYLSIFNAI